MYHDYKEKILLYVGDKMVKFTRHSDHTDAYLFRAGAEYWYSHITLDRDVDCDKTTAEHCIALIDKVLKDVDMGNVQAFRCRREKK